ncbi:MAG: DUF4892 domain-containing protein [Lysobacteraceae bacterium]
MSRILLSVLLLAASTAAFADATVPTADEPGSKDLSFLKRYEGSYIVNYEHKSFDETSFPASKLKPVADADARDSHNNSVLEADKKLDVEGEYTRILYVAPADRSPLEVIRNYLDEIQAAGGKVLYSCKNADCGGEMEGNDHGGGTQGLLEKIYPQERVKVENFTNGNCASTMDIKEQRYIVATLPGDGGDTTLGIMANTVADTLYCKALNDRTVAVVIAIESKAREKKMVTVSAGDMAKSIAATGKVALYGIFFDTGKSVVKSESKPTLEQIAALLKSQPTLKLGVVGHTDNVGGAPSNLSLSKRRADAVANALIEDYGVDAARLTPSGAGMGTPVGSNDSEAGRAKNRRVELVKK